MLQGIGGEEASTIWLQGLSQRKMSTMIDEENFCSLRRQIEAEGNAREIARLASLGPWSQRHSDALGDHAMCCGHQGERIFRHNALRDTSHDTAAAAALNSPSAFHEAGTL